MFCNQTKQKLQIAMIGQKSVPSNFGGIDSVVEALSRELVAKGNEVLLLNRKRKNGNALSEYNGIKIEECFTVNTRSLDALLYSYFATRRAKKLAKQKKLNVVHFHSEGVCLFLNSFPKREKRDYKIVVTIHGIDSMRAKWKGLGSKVLRRCEKMIAKYADEVIVLTESNAKYFKEKYGRDTILIPNAVDNFTRIEPDIITSKWGLEKGKYILTVVRIVREKGLHHLIEGWKGVPKEVKGDVKLVIAGSYAQDKCYYENILKASKDDKSIIFTDFVSGKELQELYSNAKLFVLPSELEGMSMSLLEAISYRLNCLVSDIPENLSVVGENFFSFENKNSLDLTNKLTEFLSGKVDASTEKILVNSWETIAEKTLEVYKS